MVTYRWTHEAVVNIHKFVTRTPPHVWRPPSLNTTERRTKDGSGLLTETSVLCWLFTMDPLSNNKHFTDVVNKQNKLKICATEEFNIFIENLKNVWYLIFNFNSPLYTLKSRVSKKVGLFILPRCVHAERVYLVKWIILTYECSLSFFVVCKKTEFDLFDTSQLLCISSTRFSWLGFHNKSHSGD